MATFLVMLLLNCLTSHLVATQPEDVTGTIIHLPLFRRGNRFSRREPANMTHLAEVLQAVEAKYAPSYREVEGNRLVRRWRMKDNDDENDPHLIDVAGHLDRWYTRFTVGEPPQSLEVELDMLSPDFYTVVTTSGKGTLYDASASSTHGPNDDSVHAICRLPSDEFHFHLPFTSSSSSSSGSTIGLRPIRLDFAVCRPSKSSRQTLAHAGTFLGLSPSSSSSRSTLSRLSAPSLLDQLHSKGAIAQKVWSVTLLDTETGILSLGGTIVQEVEETKARVELELKHFGDPVATPDWIAEQVEGRLKLAMPRGDAWDAHFKWTNVRGAAGWWTALMAGVWLNGAKVLKNQPILLDINIPFILAPPVAAQTFYDSIGGTKRLPSPYDAFFAFPCLNHVHIAFEIGGWNFPVMNGDGTAPDALYGPSGGMFSLGKVAQGTGYCVGSVVESRGLAHGEEWGGSGLKDVWVLGEPVFRGLGLVFDEELGRVGVRTY
ncbi:uncharacterized protein A1O9_06215 [Exophiala aquamarina CBS 119918]|uniref:Peptidase A1 domain-containing protein n=1 Tax=Exophiala aquamarina CBS 119918 TaxID=1182545 RepID=A0A072PE00_9EURO|nr:uncharacterized protein A1O9_06215 [Exophiala aquamarina CBS 119918]KEF58289.1 hypothetical protein A1O9_06215 [Exophiala aquamarina CBS 119918]